MSKLHLLLLLAIISSASILGCNRTTKTDDLSPNSAVSTIASNPESPEQATDRSSTEHKLDLLPSAKGRSYDTTIRDIVVREDPKIDGWQIEEINDLVDKQFKKLGEALSDDSKLSSALVSEFATAGFRGEMRPQGCETVFEDSGFRVLRSPQSKSHSARPTDLLSAVKHQAAILGSGKRRFKFKTIRVKIEGKTAKTKSFFQLSSIGEQATQVNSTWDCQWKLGGEKPKLSHIAVSDYEEVHTKQDAGKGGQKPGFVDVTRSLFEGNDSLHTQFVFGRDHWYSNLEGSIGVEGRGNGIAIGDANGDGLDDVYICQPAALPNRLFIRQANGLLLDTSRDAGVDWLDSSRGALFVDIDNDGDQDLVVTQRSQVLIHENDGTGNFELRRALRTVSRLFSVNAIDYDNDGDLDLYVCGYSGAQQIRPEDIFASPVPYHDANNGAPNLLLKNEGDWNFSDVTADVGLDANNLRFSLASIWDDFDNDGDLDIYVANDFGRNNLYRNDFGKFVDIAGQAGVEDIGPGMSAASGDFNNDGLADIYVSNMFSSAGSRITHDPQFKPQANSGDLAGFQRHARGNSLFQNQGNGQFADLGVQSGTMMGRWAWGSLLVDINNDGWRDAYVTNGFVTADNNNDL